jgi:glycosyltransferase involved in cell wall biosynthesis
VIIVEQDLISVVIPTYNRQLKVVRAVQSVLAQSHQNLEVIVSDDGSADETEQRIAELIAVYGDKVKYTKAETNHGVSAARNRGIELASGNFIAFLDSDDTWDGIKLEAQLAVAKAFGNGDVFIFCGGRLCDADGKTLLLWKNDRSEGPCFLTSLDNPLDMPVPPPGSWFISSSFIQKVGFFDEKMKTFEDVDFAYRVYAAGFKGYFIDKPFFLCHEDGGPHLSLMSKETIIAKEYMVKKYMGKLSRKNIARIYNSLAKDYSYFYNKKMVSLSLFRAFFSYPLNCDYFGKAFRAWFWIRKREEIC